MALEEQEIIGYREASALLGVPKGTVHCWVSRRLLSHLRLGKRLVRFRRSELVAWLACHQVPAKEVATS